MAREIEVKFPVKNFDEIRKKLKKRFRAKRVGEGLEKITFFDRPSKKLARRDMQLRVKEWRIRPRTVSTMTLKTPHKKGGTKYKEMKEEEIKINDARIAIGILEGVGFVESFRYTKYRDRWKLHGVTIELDTLKDGRRFVEIEASKQHIRSMAKLLCLDMKTASTKGYVSLIRGEK
jgi:adenylate cyclase, class 2